MSIWIAVAIFTAVLSVIEGAFFLYRVVHNAERRRVKSRLGVLTATGYAENSPEVDIERQRLLSQIPWLHRLLGSLRGSDKGRLLLEQAGIQRPVGFFVLLTIALPTAGFLVGSWTPLPLIVLAPASLLLGGFPYLYVRFKKSRRVERFHAQLPEAMELMARALKAGHAFPGGLKMVADEMDDPIGGEFNKTLSEINLGVDVTTALKNFVDRVDCADLRFFVISVILQRETGGNLAEILENIASLIRERFKLHGRIRVLSAEGRFSAIVLIGIPIFVAIALAFVNPEYIRVLLTDPFGNLLVGFAISLMALGVFVMKRMIAIKV